MKSVQKNMLARKPQDEVTSTPEIPENKVSEGTQDLLDEIDCCLADNEVDPDAELKAQAHREWDKLQARVSGFWNDETSREYNIWMARYSHLFEFCCGVPQFD